MHYRLADGVLIEPLGEVWAAYSPASGETAMLNDEAAAILETLRDGPGDPGTVAVTLAADCGVPAAELLPLLEQHWQQLVARGFLRRSEAPADAVGMKLPGP